MSYINDLSVIDETLYSFVSLGANTQATYRFFLDSVGSVGKKRTNLTVGGQLPANWESFKIFGIAFRIMKEVDYTSLMTFARDAYYSLKVADNEIKSGHLSELVPFIAIVSNTATVSFATTPAVNVDYVRVHTVTDKNGSFYPLEKGYEIEIPSQASFTVELVSGSNVAVLQNANAGFLLRGYLRRKING